LWKNKVKLIIIFTKKSKKYNFITKYLFPDFGKTLMKISRNVIIDNYRKECCL